MKPGVFPVWHCNPPTLYLYRHLTILAVIMATTKIKKVCVHVCFFFGTVTVGVKFSQKIRGGEGRKCRHGGSEPKPPYSSFVNSLAILLSLVVYRSSRCGNPLNKKLSINKMNEAPNH